MRIRIQSPDYTAVDFLCLDILLGDISWVGRVGWQFIRGSPVLEDEDEAAGGKCLTRHGGGGGVTGDILYSV